MFERLRKSPSMTATLAAFVLAAFAIPVHAAAGDQAMTVLAQASSGPLRCEIRKTQTDGSVELTGFIASARAASGNFRFVAKKSGPAGSSNIVQANTFNLAADGEQQIAHLTFNLEPASHVTLELKVESDGAECHASATL